VLAALAVGVVHLATPPPPRPVNVIRLDEEAGRARALAFGPRDLLVATAIAETVRRQRIESELGPRDLPEAPATAETFRCWRVEPGRDRAVPFGPAIPGYLATFSPDGATLAVGADSGVILLDASSDRPRPTLRTDAGRTFALAFSRDGKTLAAAGEREVTVWDTTPARGRAVTKLELGGVKSLAFAPDGRTLATGGRDGFIRLWDPQAGLQRRAFRAHAIFVSALTFSDDGRTLASASPCERTARLWEVATGRGLVALRGHTAQVQAVTFAPGGRAIATAGADDTVRLWDVASGRERARLRCPGVWAPRSPSPPTAGRWPQESPSRRSGCGVSPRPPRRPAAGTARISDVVWVWAQPP
jgi:hypothetical protein